jgi:hypothetical protein
VLEQLKKKKLLTTAILEDVVRKTTADKISINDLILAMDAGGFGLIMTIFSLPIIIPLPPPFPSLISIPMVVFSFQMMIGFRSPKLPKKLANFSVKRSVLAMMVEKSSPYINKAERFVRPRFSMLSSDWFRKIIGFFCFIFSMSVLLPLPLSNFIPGMGVLIASFGLLGRDGLIILLGLFVGSIGIIVTALTVLLGVEALDIIKDWILHWIL